MPKLNLDQSLIGHDGNPVMQDIPGQIITQIEFAQGRRLEREEVTMGMAICVALLNPCESIDKKQDVNAPTRRWMVAFDVKSKMNKDSSEDRVINLDSKTIGMIRERIEESDPPLPTDIRVPFLLALDPDLVNTPAMKEVMAMLNESTNDDSEHGEDDKLKE